MGRYARIQHTKEKNISIEKYYKNIELSNCKKNNKEKCQGNNTEHN